MPWDSAGLARGEIKAVDIVLQLGFLVNSTLVLVLVLCFWASGKYPVPSEVGRFATGSFTFQFNFSWLGMVQTPSWGGKDKICKAC